MAEAKKTPVRVRLLSSLRLELFGENEIKIIPKGSVVEVSKVEADYQCEMNKAEKVDSKIPINIAAAEDTKGKGKGKGKPEEEG